MIFSDHHAWYDAVYGRDTSDDQPHGWIQWKGTNVCVDLHCACGHHGHVDAEFFYRYQCPACQRKYAVGQIVKLIELTPDEIAHDDWDYTTDTTP